MEKISVSWIFWMLNINIGHVDCSQYMDSQYDRKVIKNWEYIIHMKKMDISPYQYWECLTLESHKKPWFQIPKHQADLAWQRLTFQDPAPDLENFGTLGKSTPAPWLKKWNVGCFNSRFKKQEQVDLRNQNLSFFGNEVDLRNKNKFGTFVHLWTSNVACHKSEIPAIHGP